MTQEYEVEMELEDALISGESVYLDLCKHSASPYIDIEEHHDLIIECLRAINETDAYNACRNLQKAQIEYLKKFKEFK